MNRRDVLAAADAIRDEALRRRPELDGASIVGIGWATVDLDRVARDVGGEWTEAPRDAALGGRAVRRPDTAGGDSKLLLLEPDTEGRLAASLARFGEGVAAIYVEAAPHRAASGVDNSSESALGPAESGPFGPARLLAGGPAWGPHVLVLDPGQSAR